MKLKGRKILSLSIIFLLLTSLVIPVAWGQNQSNETNQERTEESVNRVGLEVDEVTRLVSYSYDEDEEKFTLVVESDLTQTAVVSDVLAGVQGSQDVKEIPQNKFTLDRGKNELTFDVSSYRGKAVLGFATSRASINIVEDSGFAIFQGSPSWKDVQSSALAGLFIGGSVPVALALVKKYKEPKEPRRDL